jgi:membrane protein
VTGRITSSGNALQTTSSFQMAMNLKETVGLLKQTYSKWSEHQAPRLGASVAFYSLLSFAPLLILIAAIAALVFDRTAAQNGMIDQARQMIGDRGADTVKSLLMNAQKPSSGILASVIAFITLLFGASGVFSELRDALNTIWDAQPPAESGFLAMIRQKLFSFGMVLSVGFLLLVLLILSAALAFMGKFLGHLLPIPAPVFEALNFLVSFAVITVLFALLFRYVPSRRIQWNDVWIGAIGTALLFTIGKFLLGLYLGKASVGSAYGAAGSLVAVIVWVYYSAQIFFFGAEFTRVHADAHATAQPFAAPVESHPARQPAPAPAGLPVAVQTAPEPEQLPARPVAAVPVARTSPKIKPARSLLLAVGVGFLFGRASRKLAGSHRAD